MRVHELAKQLGLSNKDLLDVIAKMGIEGKTHSSSLQPEQVSQIETQVKGKEASGAQPQAKAATAAKSASSSPTRRSTGGPVGSSPDRKARLQRMLMQRKMARRRKATQEQEPAVEPEPEITIQVIEEKEPPKTVRADEAPPAVKQAPPEEKMPKSAEEQPAEEVSAEAEVTEESPEVSAPPATREEKAEITGKKAKSGPPPRRGRKEPEGKEKTPRKRGHTGKGRVKDQTREVIVEGIEALKSTEEGEQKRAPAAKRPPRPGTARGKRTAPPTRKKKSIRRDKRARREQQLIEQQKREEEAAHTVVIHEATTVADLANSMRIGVNELIAKLMGMGVMAAKNQRLDRETIDLVCEEYGFKVEEGSLLDEGSLFGEEEEEDTPEALVARAPVITIMGHVDHGKTKLLDAVRDSNIVDGEAGGITQHIGAYDVVLPNGRVVFLDTPGHEAFTAMRARGAMVTDVVVLVVAADDGVMPQTIEAIDHAKAAGVPIVVALNKIDLPAADPNRVLTELSQHGLTAEQWGGKTPVVEISALKRQNIDGLMETLLLEAELLELKANPERTAKGIIVEAKMDKGRGPVATVLVQTGKLNIGDNFVAGVYSGKVRALITDRGEYVEEAGPATPVEVLGCEGVPVSGDTFVALPDERSAKQASLKLQQIERERELKKIKHVSLEDLHAQIEEGQRKELNVIVKADVQGSVGALMDALGKLPSDKVRIEIIHSGVGAISESDVMLASASDALILGFNIRPTPEAEETAKQEGVDIRVYRIIYNLIEDIRSAMEGLLDARFKENTLGRCEVREVFRVDRQGMVAGVYVQDGKLQRNAPIRILRDNVILHEGKMDSLRRFKEDVREVSAGYECGIGISRFNDVRVGDSIECYEMEEVKATLEE